MRAEPRRQDVPMQRKNEHGFSLVELMIGTVLIVVGLVAIMRSCLRLHALQRLDSEVGLAYRACQTNLEKLRGMPVASLAALDGTGFDVPGPDGATPILRAAADDPDGLPGQLRVRLERSAAGRSLYWIEAAVSWRGAVGVRSLELGTFLGGVP